MSRFIKQCYTLLALLKPKGSKNEQLKKNGSEPIDSSDNLSMAVTEDVDNDAQDLASGTTSCESDQRKTERSAAVNNDEDIADKRSTGLAVEETTTETLHDKKIKRAGSTPNNPSATQEDLLQPTKDGEDNKTADLKIIYKQTPLGVGLKGDKKLLIETSFCTESEMISNCDNDCLQQKLQEVANSDKKQKNEGTTYQGYFYYNEVYDKGVLGEFKDPLLVTIEVFTSDLKDNIDALISKTTESLHETEVLRGLFASLDQNHINTLTKKYHGDLKVVMEWLYKWHPGFRFLKNLNDVKALVENVYINFIKNLTHHQDYCEISHNFDMLYRIYGTRVFYKEILEHSYYTLPDFLLRYKKLYNFLIDELIKLDLDNLIRNKHIICLYNNISKSYYVNYFQDTEKWVFDVFATVDSTDYKLEELSSARLYKEKKSMVNYFVDYCISLCKNVLLEESTIEDEVISNLINHMLYTFDYLDDKKTLTDQRPNLAVDTIKELCEQCKKFTLKGKKTFEDRLNETIIHCCKIYPVLCLAWHIDMEVLLSRCYRFVHIKEEQTEENVEFFDDIDYWYDFDLMKTDKILGSESLYGEYIGLFLGLVKDLYSCKSKTNYLNHLTVFVRTFAKLLIKEHLNYRIELDSFLLKQAEKLRDKLVKEKIASGNAQNLETSL